MKNRIFILYDFLRSNHFLDDQIRMQTRIVFLQIRYEIRLIDLIDVLNFYFVDSHNLNLIVNRDRDDYSSNYLRLFL